MSRRVWFAQDCLFTADPKIAELGTEFGPAGPMAVAHLLGAAKLQDEGGRVTISYKNLSRGAFLRSGAHARNIVARATELGVLEMIAIDKVGFEARFPKWMRWQLGPGSSGATDPTGARRQALYRDPALREAVRERDGDECRYCGTAVGWTDRRGGGGGTYDHVEPAGPNSLENLVVACRSCNSTKQNRNPDQAGMVLRPAPKQIGLSSGLTPSYSHQQKTETTTETTTTALTPKEALSAALDTLQAAEWPGGVDAIKVKQAMAAYPELSAPAAALIAVTWRQRPGFKTEHAHIAFLAALRNEQQRRDKGAKDDRPAKVYDLKTVCRDCGRRLAQAERSTGRCDPCFERYAEKVLDEDGAA